MQARKSIVSILSQLLEERKTSQKGHVDMLGCLMNKDENRYKLTDEEIIDLIITIMYSGYETVSTTSMMAVKYLHDHPKVLEEIRVSAKVLMFLKVSCCCINVLTVLTMITLNTERAFCH